MSYCRWSACDLYIIEHVDGTYTCYGLNHQELADCPETFKCATIPEMIEHVREHQAAGHDAPDWIIENLEEDNG